MTTYIKTFSLATDTMTQQINQKGLSVAQYNQGDVNTDTLNLTVTHNNTVMDLTNATVSVVFSKPDGKVVYQDTTNGVTITNAVQGQLSIALNTQTRAAAGTVIGAVRITYPGNQTLETEKFSFNVEASLASDQAIASNNDIQALQALIKFKSFTATANQTLFDISDIGSYTLGQNRLFIDVGGAPQSPNNYTETSTTSFTLSEAVPAGTIVNCRWFQGGGAYLGGHNTTHEIGGGDVIDVTKLQNYNEQIATPISNINSSLADITQNQIPKKADKSYVDTNIAAINSGPKGVYSTLTALQTAFPSGNNNIYVVTADGGWYYWNGSAWTKGGTYQSTGVADGSITPSKLDRQYTIAEPSTLTGSAVSLANLNPLGSINVTVPSSTTVYSHGKNFQPFNPTTPLDSNITNVSQTSDTLTGTVLAGKTYVGFNMNPVYLKAGNYTFHREYSIISGSASGNIGYTYVYNCDVNGNVIGNPVASIGSSVNSTTYTVPSDGYYKIGIYFNMNGTISSDITMKFFNIQIEQASAYSSYEVYKGTTQTGTNLYFDSYNGIGFYNTTNTQMTVSYSTSVVTRLNNLETTTGNLSKQIAIANYSYTAATGIDYTSGSTVSYSNAITTQVIPCTGFQNLIVSGRTSGSNGLVFYDSSNNKIMPAGQSNYSSSSPTGTFPIPTGAVSFQIAANSSDAGNMVVKLGTSNASDINPNPLKLYSIGGILLDRPNNTDYPINLIDYTNSGDGSDGNPYTSTDGTAGFSSVASQSGAKIRVPSKTFNISSMVNLNGYALSIEGDAWNYSGHPNGVYPSIYGSRIRMTTNTIAAFLLVNGANGIKIKDIGIEGTVKNSNTQGLFSVANASQNTGFLFNNYIDQVNISHVNCVGLASGVAVVSGATLDASTIEWVNADGCNVGIFFNPTSAYYTKIKDCILSDCPSQGIWVASGSDFTLDHLVLVRNCGGITSTQLADTGSEAASALVKGVSRVTIKNCQIDNTGLWKEFFSSGTGAETDHTTTATGLILDGYSCMIFDNRINGATGNSAIFRGGNNQINNNYFYASDSVIISGNYTTFSNNRVLSDSSYSIQVQGSNNKIYSCEVNKPIYVTGNNNIINNCMPDTSSQTTLVIIAPGATGNILRGFDASQITDNGTNTVIK